MRHLDELDTLSLNADHRPLGLVGWRAAIEATARGSSHPVAFHAEAARSPGGRHPIPSVMVRARHVRTDRPAAYSRRNMFLAYAMPTGPRGTAEWRCALCGEGARADELTFDHLVPRARGGTSGWGNCCLAHARCNQRKGDRTLAEAGLRLHVQLRHPSDHAINQARVRFSIHRTPPADWAGYVSDLYWETTLDA